MNVILNRSQPINTTKRMSASMVITVGTLVFIGFFMISLRTLGSFTQDESQFHYPNLLNYVQNGWTATFNDQYSAANTPLPYMLVAAMTKLVGPSLLLARVVTAIVSFLTFLVAAKLLEREGAPIVSVFAIVFFPYFFASAFVFYAVNYGLLFLLLALLVLQRGPAIWTRDLLVGALLAAAVLCQQFYLVVPVAILLHRCWEVLRKPAGPDRLAMAALAEIMVSGTALLLPLLVPLALFVAWGGMTHRNFRIHAIAFSPTNITGTLFVIGFYFLPYLVQARRRVGLSHLIAALAMAVALMTWFRPQYSDVQGAGLFTGLVYHLMHLVQTRVPALGLAMLTLLVTAGLLNLWIICRSLQGTFERLLFCVLVLLTGPYWMTTEIAERHLLGLVVILLLLALPKLRTAQASWYAAYMALLGSGYFFYWTFFKFD